MLDSIPSSVVREYQSAGGRSGKFSIALFSNDTFAAYLGSYGGRAIHMMYSARATYSPLTA